jgi:hypothetical protein
MTWIYFLREMYDLPMAYYLPVQDKISYKDTRDENDFIEFLAQGGLVGNLVGSGSIARFKRNVEVINGSFESCGDRLDEFFHGLQGFRSNFATPGWSVATLMTLCAERLSTPMILLREWPGIAVFQLFPPA